MTAPETKFGWKKSLGMIQVWTSTGTGIVQNFSPGLVQTSQQLAILSNQKPQSHLAKHLDGSSKTLPARGQSLLLPTVSFYSVSQALDPIAASFAGKHRYAAPSTPKLRPSTQLSDAMVL